MKLTQKVELRKLLVPELQQSLEILSLPLSDLKALVEQELVNNPFLEEKMVEAPEGAVQIIAVRSQRNAFGNGPVESDVDPFAQLAKLPSLNDVLSRQLGMALLDDAALRAGREIIGNIDHDGYFRCGLDEIAATAGVPVPVVEKTLKYIQHFEPLGVGARNIQECLLIQCEGRSIEDPLLEKIIAGHLDDVAKRKCDLIARQCRSTLSDVEASVRKLTSLNPKPGQNYAVEEICDIMPDILIEEKNGEIELHINKETLPAIVINEEYRDVLKNDSIPEETKEYLRLKLQDAMELLRAIARRQSTLRHVLEVVAGIQKDALLKGMSHLKPMTCQDVADKIDMHPSTVCRVVMHKYAQTPQGVVALKSFFTSGIQLENGEEVSSCHCKIKIKGLIEAEDKQCPFSDEDLAGILLKDNGIKLARRTVAKYREELKFLPSLLRRER